MNYDTDRVHQLVTEYEDAEGQRARREIENKILEATVWQNEDDEECGFGAYSRDEIRLINRAVPNENKRVKALLRRPHVKDVV